MRAPILAAVVAQDVGLPGRDHEAELVGPGDHHALQQILAHRPRPQRRSVAARAHRQQLLGEGQRLNACARPGGGNDAPHAQPPRRCRFQQRRPAPRAPRRGVLGQDPRPGARARSRPAPHRGRSSAASASSVVRAIRISRPGSKNMSSPAHQSDNSGAPHAAASNSRPDGQKPISRHRRAGGIQRKPRGGVERRMLRRRQVADKVDVLRPREIRRILRAADQESLRAAAAGPAPGAGAPESPAGRRRRCRDRRAPPALRPGAAGTMQRRIDRAVERCDAPRAQARAQRRQRRAAGVAQHEVEAAQPLGREIRHRLSRRQPRQRHRGIEVVEAAHRAAVQHQRRRRPPVRTIGGDDRRVGPRQGPSRLRQRRPPIGIEHEPRSVGKPLQVAMFGVPRDIALEEHDAMSRRRQRADQAPPERCMAVSPGRADREPEDDEVHAPPSGGVAPPAAGSGRPSPTPPRRSARRRGWPSVSLARRRNASTSEPSR